MLKSIGTVNFNILNDQEYGYIRIEGTPSLSDYDIVIMSAQTTEFNYSDNLDHWHREIENFLEKGKTLFIIGCGKEGEGFCNYDIFPSAVISSGSIHSAKGTKVKAVDKRLLKFCQEFEGFISYKVFFTAWRACSICFVREYVNSFYILIP